MIYTHICRVCGESFQSPIGIKFGGTPACKTCRHVGLGGFLMAPLFLLGRIIAFIVWKVWG